MAILYNMEPLAALELFYDGEKRGVWEGDLIKNEKKRGLVLPPMLKEFLEKYAYLDVNSGEETFKIFHPDGIGGVLLRDDEEGDIHLLVIGVLNELWIAVRMDECDYLRVVFGEKTENGTVWTPTENGSLEGIFTIMFCAQLFKSADSFVFEDEAEINAVLKKHGAERGKILPSGGNAQHISVCYSEESGAFLAAEFNKDMDKITMLHVVPRKTAAQRKAEKYATVSTDELRELFEGEFYGNAMHCDFAHALELQLEIIKRLEADGADEIQMFDHYRLAGRCLWALKRIDEADDWYAKAADIAERSGDPKMLADCCHTLANYYADTGRQGKSDEMFDRELALRREHFPGDVYHLGRIYEVRAQLLEGDDGRLGRLIELCEMALEEFKKDPHDSGCKYETARVQQLRGNARRRKKELDKLKNA